MRTAISMNRLITDGKLRRSLERTAIQLERLTLSVKVQRTILFSLQNSETLLGDCETCLSRKEYLW